jgi:hypothetical protein
MVLHQMKYIYDNIEKFMHNIHMYFTSDYLYLLHLIDKFSFYIVIDRNIAFLVPLSHALPVAFWKTSCKSSLLPVDRKYQKGQSRDNCKNRCRINRQY